METQFSKMQQLKRRFFALRNGVVADVMRRAGAPYRIVFGLMLPELSRVAQEFGPDTAMARALWRNSSTRESQLIAPMMVRADDIDADEALRWVAGAAGREAIDVLCLKLLRSRPYAGALAATLAECPGDLMHYAALRLYFNLLPHQADAACETAQRELALGNQATAALARQLLDEIEFASEA